MEKKECEFIARCSFKNICDGPFLCDRREEYVEKLKHAVSEEGEDFVYDCQFKAFCGGCYQDPDCCDKRIIYEGFVAFKRRKELENERR